MHRGSDRGTWVGDVPLPLFQVSESPVTLTLSRSASYLGPKARDLQVIFKCQGSDAKSISAQDGPLWPHSYLKVLDDKIVQNTEHIKEIITGIFGGAKGKI